MTTDFHVITASGLKVSGAGKDSLAAVLASLKVIAKQRQMGDPAVDGEFRKNGVVTQVLKDEHWVIVAYGRAPRSTST